MFFLKPWLKFYFNSKNISVKVMILNILVPKNWIVHDVLVFLLFLNGQNIHLAVGKPKTTRKTQSPPINQIPSLLGQRNYLGPK